MPIPRPRGRGSVEAGPGDEGSVAMPAFPDREVGAPLKPNFLAAWLFGYEHSPTARSGLR